jgi:uncharacterized Zn-finger protein
MDTAPYLSLQTRSPKATATTTTIIQPIHSSILTTSNSQSTHTFAQFPTSSILHPISAASVHSSSDSNKMRRSNTMAEIPLPITYTPTTHRISKAKKGKRVHACEFPGCNKVFTRAEHRRRHELNHNPEASFPCTYDGCRKAFHRSDLLQRHMERQYVITYYYANALIGF